MIIIFFVLVAGLFSYVPLPLPLPLASFPSLPPSLQTIQTDKGYRRRRRRLGRQPMYGTGWIPYNHPSHYANHPSNQNNPNNPNYQNQQNTPPKYGDPNYAPPPPYQGQQSTGQTFNSADGYYGHGGANGGQGIELQQPSSSYQPQRERMGDDAGDIGVGGSNVYDAPVGPPPAKGMWGSSEARVVR